MSSSHSSSTSTTQQPGRTANASASATAPPQKTVIVSGEAKDSVTVQSQLATSHVAGDVTSKSNLGQVIQDLSAAHTASSGWVDQESQRINQWGHGEIERVLAATKVQEEQLIAGAKKQQLALDQAHAAEMQKLVQQMDLRKAAQLKELEDNLQRQIQATLSNSKSEINRIESEMNSRKMDLLKQSQLKSAAEIDKLTNLVVETKLVPSQTRTVIETNTNTGSVMAVATGGSISTGAAEADAYTSTKVVAVPNAGQLAQQAEVTRGDMVQDSTGRKVGSGAIVNTMTGVQEQQTQGAGGAGRDVTVAARPLTNMSGTGTGATQRPLTTTSASTSGPAVAGGNSNLGAGHQGGQAWSVPTNTVASNQPGPGTTAGHHIPMHHDGEKSSYTSTSANRDGSTTTTKESATRTATDSSHAKSSTTTDPAYNKHNTSASGTDSGLMGKVKHALGMEPTSTDSTTRRA